jgi:hypothetical protein
MLPLYAPDHLLFHIAARSLDRSTKCFFSIMGPEHGPTAKLKSTCASAMRALIIGPALPRPVKLEVRVQSF